MLLGLLENKKKNFPLESIWSRSKIHIHLLSICCVLGVVPSAGKMVPTRVGEVLSHTEFMVRGEDVRPSTLSEAIAVRGEVQGTGGAHSRCTWPHQGERRGGQGELLERK